MDILKIDTDKIIKIVLKNNPLAAKDFNEEMNNQISIMRDEFSEKESLSFSHLDLYKSELAIIQSLLEEKETGYSLLKHIDYYKAGKAPNVKFYKEQHGKFIFVWRETAIMDGREMYSDGKEDFFNDMYWIKKGQYVNEKIRELQEPELKEESNRPLLQWNAGITTLYTLFYDLLEKGVITWNGKNEEGEKMEIARMLHSHFVDKEGKKLSVETIKQTLKPNTPKAKKRLDVSPIALLPKNRMRKT